MVRKVVFLFATDEISLDEWALPSHGRTQVRSGDPGDDLHHLEAQYGGCRTDIDPGNEHPHAGECSGSWSDPEGKARQTPVPSHSRQELVTWDPDEYNRVLHQRVVLLSVLTFPTRLSSHKRRAEWHAAESGVVQLQVRLQVQL